MKTLIINGSPRRNGDTVSLLNILKDNLQGEIREVSAYYDEISPCVDCRYCWKHGECCIKDDMDLIYGDDYDNLIIASPIYVSNLTGPLMSLGSRLQAYYVAKQFLGIEKELKDKTGVLMLVGGGDGSPDRAVKYAQWMFKKLNAKINDDNMVFSLKTNECPAIKDDVAISKIKQIALKLNGLQSS